MKCYLNIAAFLGALLTSAASAVEIVQVNNQSWIVNIDAQKDALRSNSPGIFLEAGQYVVSPIDEASGGRFTAWNAWSYTECQDPKGCPKSLPGFSLTFGLRLPYVSKIYSQNASGDFVDEGLADCFTNNNKFVFCQTSGAKRSYPSQDLAYSSSRFPIKFRLAEAGHVSFGVDDSPEYLGDNQGGVSLFLQMIKQDDDPVTVKAGGLHVESAVCKNLTTRKTVRIRLDGKNEANCATSGLKYKRGDKVRLSILGRALGAGIEQVSPGKASGFSH